MNRPWSKKRVPTPALPPRLSAVASRDAVNKVVTELHAQGAVDAGNADVLDGWIDTLRPQWQAHATMASTQHEAVAQLVVGDSEAAAVAARRRADAARADVEHTQRLIAAFEAALIPDNGPDAADRRNRRPDLEPLEGLTESRWRKFGRLVLMALVGAGDLATFYLTLAVLLGDEVWLTWVLVGSFTVASMALMHAAGSTAKNIREGQGGLPKAAVAAMVLAWAALGGVAFYVRLSSPVTSTDVGFGVDPATVTGPSPTLSAVLLAGLFVASGFLAFQLGFAHHPRMSTYRSLRTQLAAQRTTATATEQAAIAAERALTNACAEQERARLRAAGAVTSVEAEITELKELARLHLAGLLGEPASTNAVTARPEPSPEVPPRAAVVPRKVGALRNGSAHVNGSPQSASRNS